MEIINGVEYPDVLDDTVYMNMDLPDEIPEDPGWLKEKKLMEEFDLD
jgi:hypothetical protein